MNKQLIIVCSRMVLVLDESELIKSLSLDILQQAISKGKGYQRAVATSRRQSQGFDRWQLYEALKGNRHIDDLLIQTVKIMPVVELREGIIEYLLSQMRNVDTG